MNQKCRYCANAYAIDVGLIYCEPKDKTMRECAAKRINKCADFEFNPINVLGEKDYQEPKTKAKAKSEYEQLEMLGKEKSNEDTRKEDCTAMV